MNYLYGDSTASQLKSNFLEFLRDAIDFCVFVLQADARMKAGRVQIRLLGEEADAESERLDRFITSVSRAVHNGEKGDNESPTAKCGARLSSLIVDAHRASIDGIRQTLADATSRIEAEEAAGRDACVRALGTLLAPHDPPDSTTVMQLSLGDSGRYQATLSGKAEPTLSWTLEIGIPDGHAWSSLIRVDRLVPHLEIKAPQLAGWITKEVRIKPQKIERYIVTKVVDDAKIVNFEVRTEASHDIGYDFEASPEKGSVKAVRIGPADDASVGSFELAADDVALMMDLATKLHGSLAGLERRPNISAVFDETDFRTLPSYIDFVEQLVSVMAPIVREISKRSLTPNELVLRRLLGDDRREEIFIAKATLREKLDALPDDLRRLFAPLGLEVGVPMSAPMPAAPVVQPGSDRPPLRSELPPSAPPPKPVVIPHSPRPRVAHASTPPAPAAVIAPPKSTPSPVPPPAAVPRPADVVAAAQANANATAPVSMFQPMRSNPPPAMAPRTLMPQGAGAPPPAPGSKTNEEKLPPPAPETQKGMSDAPSIEVSEEEIEISSDALMEVVPESRRELISKPDGGQPRNEALVLSLKKIMTLSKNGRASEAYQEYENLFSSPSFGEYRPDDQRQALKLMVLAKSHPADRDAVASAHRAALGRLKTLVDSSSEPADQELLGVAHLFLGDEKAASAAFQAGLDSERTRNPQSELIATLMRRVSQL